MKLYRIILPVQDIEQATQFYGKILQNTGERVSEGRHYFDCGGTILACYDPVADGDDLEEGWHKHSNQYIYFAVDNLESFYELALKAGAANQGEIVKMPWGERLFYMNDPFGNPICFVDNRTVFVGAFKS